MKKILIVLVIIISLIFPKIVKADMGPPMIEPYDATISNASGASLYDSSTNKVLTTIPFGTKITVEYEYELSNGNYVTYINYNKIDGYIFLKDITNSKDSSKPSSKNYFKETRYLYVVGDDIDLYSGPSFSYTKVAKSLPSKSILTYNYTDSEGGWAYTNYNGIDGWIEIVTNEVGLSCSYWEAPEDYNHDILILSDAILYDFPSLTKGNILETKISSMTKKIYTYSYNDIRVGSWVYVSTDSGVEGWINNSSTKYADAYKTILLTYGNITLYSSPLNGGTKSSQEVTSYTELAVSYTYYIYENDTGTTWYYVSYKNKNYWVNSNQKIAFANSDTDAKVTIGNDQNIYIYSGPDTSSTMLMKSAIPSGTILEYTYNIYIYTDSTQEEWLYITYEGISGWIHFLGDDSTTELTKEYTNALSMVEKAEKSKSKNDVYEAYAIVNALDESQAKVDLLNRLSNISIIEDDDKKNDEEDVVKNSKLTPIQTISICVGGAFILALASLVTIKLLKKKKERKIQNQVQTVQKTSDQDTAIKNKVEEKNNQKEN